MNYEKNGLCTASLVLGILGFFINPCYIMSILAIVFGAVGKGKPCSNAGQGRTGMILGIIAIIVQLVIDIIITIFSAGIGFVTFCC